MRARAALTALASAAALHGCAGQSPFPMPTPEIGWPNSTRPAEAREPAPRTVSPTGPRQRREDDDSRLRRLLDDAEARTRPVFRFDTLVGARAFADDRAWEPLDDQLDLGVSYVTPLLGERSVHFDRFSDWLSWDLGIAYAFDRSDRADVEVESQIFDLSAGLIFEPPRPDLRLSPYVGAGWTLSFTDFDEEVGGMKFRERDVVGSPYLRGGMRFRLDPYRHVGVDVRWRAPGDDEFVDGVGGSIESTTVALLFGAAF